MSCSKYGKPPHAMGGKRFETIFNYYWKGRVPKSMWTRSLQQKERTLIKKNQEAKNEATNPKLFKNVVIGAMVTI
jgi:hypothetical protein